MFSKTTASFAHAIVVTIAAPGASKGASCENLLSFTLQHTTITSASPVAPGPFTCRAPR